MNEQMPNPEDQQADDLQAKVSNMRERKSIPAFEKADEILTWFTEMLDNGTFPRIPKPHFLYSYYRRVADLSGIDSFDAYFSTAISSGGAVHPDEHGETLSFADALKYNFDFSVALAGAMIADNGNLLSATKSVNPVHLGKVPLWEYECFGAHKVDRGRYGQPEYLRFWFPVILGLQAPKLDKEKTDWYQTELVLDTLFDVHKELMGPIDEALNDKTLPMEQRQLNFAVFTGSFVQLVDYMCEVGVLEKNPVKKLITLIDTNISMGGRSEQQLTVTNDVSVYQAALTGDNWLERGLGEMADMLKSRKAQFAAPTGRVAIALSPDVPTFPEYELPPLSEEHKKRLQFPIMDCFLRTYNSILQNSVVDQANESADFYNRGLPTVFDFGYVRKKPYLDNNTVDTDVFDVLDNPDASVADLLQR